MEPMAGRTVLITGATSGIGKATAWAWPGWVRTWRSPAETAGAPRTRLARSVQPAAGRWTCSSRTCPPSRRYDGWPRRYSEPFSDRCADQQRRRVLGHPARHRRRARAHLRPQPSRAVPAHQPAAGPAEAERPGPCGHGLVQRADHGTHRLQRPPGRTVLLRGTGVQPVQARQRPIQLRAGQEAATAPRSPPTRCIPAW